MQRLTSLSGLDEAGQQCATLMYKGYPSRAYPPSEPYALSLLTLRCADVGPGVQSAQCCTRSGGIDHEEARCATLLPTWVGIQGPPSLLPGPAYSSLSDIIDRFEQKVSF